MRYSESDLLLMANAVRILSADAIELAKSGHPGLPLGMADVASVLFAEFLQHNPKDPTWINRDRFILSAGHGSMLLYSLLHLSGYSDFPIDAICKFRKLHSTTAGHPEYGIANGIEISTGPLGQGLASAVGMAIAEKKLSYQFSEFIDHYHYVIAGDGCLMEGLSHEACSLAGRLKLNKLIVLFDNNNITIDGNVNLSCKDDLDKRMHAYNWQYLSCDGHNPKEIYHCIKLAKQNLHQPTLISCKTTIGYGVPLKAGTEKVHGTPLGAASISGLRKNLNWPWQDSFFVPIEIRKLWESTLQPSLINYEKWQDKYKNHNQAISLDNYLNKPINLDQELLTFKEEQSQLSPNIATRQASKSMLEFLVPRVPQLLGGSADLSHSNLTQVAEHKVFDINQTDGNYIHYGVREFAMACALNGLALHGGFIPYGGAFLVFSDYCRSAIRSAALMQLKVIYILTHDSIGVGEDGPTHQPVEHLASLRAIPRCYLFRPMDIVELIECWQLALTLKAPSIFALSRQASPTLRTEHSIANLSTSGAYILKHLLGQGVKIAIWSSGTEVNLAIKVAENLHKSQGYEIFIITVPCLDLFKEQNNSAQAELKNLAKYNFVIEAGISMGWEGICSNGKFFGVEDFGISAPAEQVFAHFKLTEDEISTNIQEFIKSQAN